MVAESAGDNKNTQTIRDSGVGYKQAIAILNGALKFGIEPSLVSIKAICERMNNPQNQYKCIQIAGTNGKSSTARFTAAFLHAQGFKVGLYTSPELVEYPERIEIDGKVVDHTLFAKAILKADQVAGEAIRDGLSQSATEFTLLTAAAFWLFADQNVDYAVLEVGLGGRWDATSVANPLVAVVTGIDLDHTAVLGDTVEQIAREKAAIIKSGSIAILGEGTGETADVFAARVKEVGAKGSIFASVAGMQSGLDCSHFPNYQKQNIACALKAAGCACGKDLASARAQEVLDAIVLPGRFELISADPLILIDAAHNPNSAKILAVSLSERFGVEKESGRLRTFKTLVLAVLKDKDALGIIRALLPLFDSVIITQTESKRAIPALELAALVQEELDSASARKPQSTSARKELDSASAREPQSAPKLQVCDTVAEAYKAIVEQGAAAIATGSITLAGEMKKCVSGRHFS